jgi:hypothetical protein
MITVDLETQLGAKPGDPLTLWGDGLAVKKLPYARKPYLIAWYAALPWGCRLLRRWRCRKYGWLDNPGIRWDLPGFS